MWPILISIGVEKDSKSSEIVSATEHWAYMIVEQYKLSYYYYYLTVQQITNRNFISIILTTHFQQLWLHWTPV